MNKGHTNENQSGIVNGVNQDAMTTPVRSTTANLNQADAGSV